MRYAYNDLGQQQAGTVVTLQLTGSVANVMLMDEANFPRYRAGQPFLYEGGHYRRSPVELTVPEDGHWFVVMDLGGYKGRVKGSVEVQSSDENQPPVLATMIAVS